MEKKQRKKGMTCLFSPFAPHPPPPRPLPNSHLAPTSPTPRVPRKHLKAETVGDNWGQDRVSSKPGFTVKMAYSLSWWQLGPTSSHFRSLPFCKEKPWGRRDEVELGLTLKKKRLHSSPCWRRLDSQQILSNLTVTYVYTLQQGEVWTCAIKVCYKSHSWWACDSA